MKSIFRIAAIAVIAMGLTVACKSKTAEPVEDTTAIETIVDDTTDTIEEMAEEIAENIEEPVKNEVKKQTKKAEEVKTVADDKTANTTTATTGRKSSTRTEEAAPATKATAVADDQNAVKLLLPAVTLVSVLVEIRTIVTIGPTMPRL